MHHSNLTVPEAGNFSSQQWINSQQINFKIEHTSEDELISPSSLSVQTSQDPWSPAGQPRFLGQARPHHVPWGPADSLGTGAGSYPPSALSPSPSPLIEGFRTPDSTKSPMFTNAHLYGSSAASSGGDSSQVYFQDFQQQTPMAPQVGFQHATYGNQYNDLAGITAPPQTQMLDQNAGHKLNREPTYSPIEDFVVVDYNDVLPTSMANPHTTPTVKQPPHKVSKKSTSSKARHEKTVFIPEGYPLSADANRRRANELARQRHRDSKRAGGRSVGMHLNADSAARAKQLREEGSCWICCLQRDSVSFCHTDQTP